MESNQDTRSQASYISVAASLTAKLRCCFAETPQSSRELQPSRRPHGDPQGDPNEDIPISIALEEAPQEAPQEAQQAPEPQNL
jgi:hypothetical protein